MQTFLKKLPLSISGVILAIVSLGNLLKLLNFLIIGNIVGIIGIFLSILLILKIVVVYKHTYNLIKEPFAAAVIPSFTVALMVVCTYLVDFNLPLIFIKYLWIVIIILHIGLMIYFTYFFVISPKLRLQDIYPSWLIVYVGIGGATVTCLNFSITIGQVIFWTTLISYFITMPIVIHRIYVLKGFAKAHLPMKIIIAAPGSLCLAGYITAFEHPNIYLVVLLLVLSQTVYVLTLFHFPETIKLPFYPSYSSFTFPMVITATSVVKVKEYLIKLNKYNNFFDFIIWGEVLIAILIVTYVLIHYLKYIFSK